MYEIVNVQYTGTYNNSGTSIPAVLGEFRASSAADLPAQNVDCHIICGCDGLDIATGDRYIWNGTAWILQPSDRAFSNVYTKSEIDNMVSCVYSCIAYYHHELISNDGTITFYAFAGTIKHISIYGNMEQETTPTPDNPIQPDFIGVLNGINWIIPITNAGHTTNIDISNTQTVRKIKKLVLTGLEEWHTDYGVTMVTALLNDAPFIPMIIAISDRYVYNPIQSGLSSGLSNGEFALQKSGTDTTGYNFNLALKDARYTTATDIKTYLATQYANGTPVTVWYVLANEQTAIVNEPLCKIGTYADELHLTAANVSIPTVSGENTLTVDTDLPPSKIVISGEG